MKLPILIGSDPRLRKAAAKVTAEELASSQMQEFIDELIPTMQTADGIGLAAPQVGISSQIIIVVQDDTPMCLVNPSFKPLSDQRELGEEGCLSFPGLFGKVARFKSITVTALDRHGKQLSFEAYDLNARVIQHEIDHLNGVLLPDRLKEKEEAPEASVARRSL